MPEDFYVENATPKAEETHRFPCSACGGNMAFNPETQKLVCPYCSNSIDIDTESGDIQEYDLEEGLENASKDWGEATRVIRCESCGAQTVLAANSAAEFCSFCGSSYIIKDDETETIKPESLIPFKVGRKEAVESFKKWIKKRWFAPNELKKSYQLNKISGVYIPYWTYDSETYSVYRAEKGTYYYVTETHQVQREGKTVTETRRVRKTRWKSVSGNYSKFFDDLLINASKQLDGKTIQKLEPFKLDELIPYNPRYLSGFAAERYSIDLKQGWEKAKEIIKNKIRTGVIQQINGDEVRNLHVNTSFDNVKFKHLLLPIWISTYAYRGKNYQFIVNGQTGEVQGKSPLSKLKIGFIVLAGVTVIGLIYWLYRRL